MFKRAFFVAITMFLLIFFHACKAGDNKSDEHKGEAEFYYYPSANAYFDPGKKAFLYSLNGGKTWSTFTSNNPPPATLGQRVIIYSRHEDVYRDNDNHRKLYGGNSFNFNVAYNDTATTVAEVSERKKVEKKVVAKTNKPVTEKPKNKIGKFISKIFGKHKKK